MILQRPSARHFGVLSVLICYCTALYFLVPTFNPDIVLPGLSNFLTHFTITYLLGACCSWFTRVFYVSSVGFRFELISGLVVTPLLFLLIGAPLQSS
ncbi:MAG: hypothetical protein ACR2O8_05030 [Rhizobiaceae bacterium]